MLRKLFLQSTRFERLLTAVLVIFFLGATVIAVAHGSQAAVASTEGQVDLALDPDKSEIHWTLGSTLHTVHGTFKFKSGDLRLDTVSGRAGGEIIVAATSGDSQNEGRNNKMHKDVLESAKYQDIVFKADRVEGKVAASGASSALVHGVLTLHGTDHEMGIPVQAELSGDHWKATGKFTVPYVKWGLKNPSNFLLHVKPDVDIELRMTGSLKSIAGN
jgi:polyisoprenoid-binding protein YceI